MYLHPVGVVRVGFNLIVTQDEMTEAFSHPGGRTKM